MNTTRKQLPAFPSCFTSRNEHKWRVLFVTILVLALFGEPSSAFTTNSNNLQTIKIIPKITNRRFFNFKMAPIDENDDDDNNNNNDIDDNQIIPETSSSTSIFSRILNPVIDDKALPLNDAAVAQIIGPSLQLFTLTSTGSALPSWSKPIFGNALFEYRGSLVAPTLIHGAGLATCWLLGALMARAYEQEAIDPTATNGGYATIAWRIIQAGSFASGLLIFSTQMDLLLEFGGKWIQLGESPETDVRLYTASVEVIQDIFFEILALVPIRLFLAKSIEREQSGR